MSTDKKIGFWKSSSEPELPMPVSNTESFNKKDEFLARLASIEKNKSTERKYRGFSVCRICNCSNGISEYSFGGFVWPSGYSHYIEKHNVIPDKVFFDFVMSEEKTAVKMIFGHITDGPSTSFLPDTLEQVLKEKEIDSDLVEEIMKTINAQMMSSYNEGYTDGKERGLQLAKKLQYAQAIASYNEGYADAEGCP